MKNLGISHANRAVEANNHAEAMRSVGISTTYGTDKDLLLIHVVL